jgi:hypothetical protein
MSAQDTVYRMQPTAFPLDKLLYGIDQGSCFPYHVGAPQPTATCIIMVQI